MTGPAIRATGLVKTYGTARAVDGVELTVPTGGVYGLLGPNGAGKTTTIRILTTLLRPDAGTAEVFGHDVVRQAAVLVVGLGLVMGYRPHGGVVGVLAGLGLILLFGYCLSWLWTTLGLLVRTPTSVTLLSFVVQIPLTFASNVFVDPATMPGWLRAFVSVNPVSHLVTAERGLLSGTVTAGDLGWVFVACAGLLAVFAPLTMLLYRRLR